jgi:hypothetical protein
MVMLGREVRGSVRKVAGKAEQFAKARRRRFRQLDVDAEPLTDRQLDRLVRHNELAIEMGSDGLGHETISLANGYSTQRQSPENPRYRRAS